MAIDSDVNTLADDREFVMTVAIEHPRAFVALIPDPHRIVTERHLVTIEIKPMRPRVFVLALDPSQLLSKDMTMLLDQLIVVPVNKCMSTVKPAENRQCFAK